MNVPNPAWSIQCENGVYTCQICILNIKKMTKSNTIDDRTNSARSPKMPRARDNGTAQGKHDVLWLVFSYLSLPIILCKRYFRRSAIRLVEDREAGQKCEFFTLKGNFYLTWSTRQLYWVNLDYDVHIWKGNCQFSMKKLVLHVLYRDRCKLEIGLYVKW